ncbi:MAG: SH3 domain-containing protein [bacterium]|nr:SH3 domain-containing protein [bacterium]
MPNKRPLSLIILIFSAIALFMLALYAPLFAAPLEQEEQPGDVIYGLIAVDGSEVRVGPDFAYESIGRLPLNASVTVLGRAGDFFRTWDGRQWLEIQYGDRRAWVYARLIRTSVAFNSIFPTGRLLPRNNDGRVPDGFDLATNVCDQWSGGYTQTGNFMALDPVITVTYPGLQGANAYSVIVIAPDGTRRAFDSETTTAEIILDDLPTQAGVYTWRIAPYWTNSTSRSQWQQVCLLRTGGTFEKPLTGYPATATAEFPATATARAARNN